MKSEWKKAEGLSTKAKRSLGRPMRRCENNVRIDLKEIGVARNWVDSALDRDYCRVLVNVTLNLRVLLVMELVGGGDGRSSWDWLRTLDVAAL